MGAYVYKSHLGGYYTSAALLDSDQLYCEQCGDSDWCCGWYNTFREFLKSNADDIDVGYVWGEYILESVIDDIGSAFDDNMTYEEAKEIVLKNRTVYEEDE